MQMQAIMEPPLGNRTKSSAFFAILPGILLLVSGCSSRGSIASIETAALAPVFNNGFEESLAEPQLISGGAPETETVLVYSPTFSQSINSKCKTAMAAAELDAIILKAPTLSAAIDKYGEGQVALSYDLMNIKAIELNKRKVIAKCRIAELLGIGKAMQKLSARSLTKPGMQARVGFVDLHQKRFKEMQNALEVAVRAGTIKEKVKAKVLKSIASLLERNNGFRAKARVLSDAEFDELPNFPELKDGLYDAASELHVAQAESSVAKNVRFTLSAGYDYTNDVPVGGELDWEGFGKATLSVRLGVLSPDWDNGQHVNLEAEIAQFSEPKTGVLWNIEQTYQQNAIATEVLMSKRRELLNKLELAKIDKSQISPDDMAASMLQEIAIVKLNSEMKEINTNLTVLQAAQKKLKS